MGKVALVSWLSLAFTACATTSFTDRFPDEPKEPETLAVAQFSFDGVADGPRYYQRIGRATGADAVVVLDEAGL